MAGTVLYRKWRPRRFADLVGQDAIVRTLRNAVAQGKPSHAYLFSGPRGTGKTSAGRILAAAINSPPAPDGEPAVDDPLVRAFEDGTALDLVEIDAASNRGIDNIRDLRERANYVPSQARYKVYLIDEVHQLTDAAADALLKTLEEPPPHVVFILATTDPEALKPTILSRCQRFDFRRIGAADIVGRLRIIAAAEQIQIPDEALMIIAREATGSLRDAVNLLDQVWATCGDAVSVEDTVAALGLSTDQRALALARAALSRDLKAGLATIAAVQDDALDLVRFNRQVIQHLRHALLVQSGAAQSLALSEPEAEAVRALAKGVDPATTVAALKAFSTADLRTDPYAALPLELALARLIYEPEPVAVALAAAGRAAAARSGGASADGGAREAGPKPRRSAAGGRPPSPRPSGERPAPPPRHGAAPARAASDPTPTRAAPSDAPPPPPARERTPEEQLLDGIRETLKRQGDQQLAAMLNGSCRVTVQGDDTVALGFYPLYVDFHKTKVEERQDAVAEAASSVLGRRVHIACTAAEEAPRQRSSLADAAEKMGGKVIQRRAR